MARARVQRGNSKGQTVQKDAYTLILEAIDAGLYKPGDRLVESELAERLGVSRTPVREALQRLETQSMLTRDGRSQVEVIEDALERAPEPSDLEAVKLDAFMIEIRQICARIAEKPRRWKTLAEFDAHEYDERGNLR